MQTYDVELPTDIDTFHHWFTHAFTPISEWAKHLSVNQDPPLDQYQHWYEFTYRGQQIALVNLYHFRRDRLRVLSMQFLPWEGDNRFILKQLQIWIVAMYGRDNVHEFREDATAAIMAGDSDRIYWTDVHKAAKASGNISQYLRDLEIYRSTYYDKVKKYRLSGNPDRIRTTEPDNP